MALHKNVRVLPPGTQAPGLRTVNIRGIEWGGLGRWDKNQDDTRAFETVIDAGWFTPGLKEIHLPGYIPGGWTLPLRIDLDFAGDKYRINDVDQPWSRILVSWPRWGRFDPATVVPGVGISDPQGGKCYFAIEPNLSHILTYLGLRAWLYFGRTGHADIRLGFTDDQCRRLQWAGLAVSNCRIVNPAGKVTQNSANNPVKTQHQLDVEMTNTSAGVRIDLNSWTRPAAWDPIIATPPPTEVVFHLAGPLTLKRIVLETTSLPPAELGYDYVPQEAFVPPDIPDEDGMVLPDPEPA